MRLSLLRLRAVPFRIPEVRLQSRRYSQVMLAEQLNDEETEDAGRSVGSDGDRELKVEEDRTGAVDDVQATNKLKRVIGKPTTDITILRDLLTSISFPAAIPINPYARLRTSRTLSALHLAQNSPTSPETLHQLSSFTDPRTVSLLGKWERKEMARLLRASKQRWRDGPGFEGIDLPHVEFAPPGPWRPTEGAVREHEEAFLRSLPALIEQGEKGKKIISGHVNHMLHLTALIPSEKMFGQVLGLFPKYGLEEDSYTHLARVVLWTRTEQVGNIAPLWKQIVARKLPDAEGDVVSAPKSKGDGDVIILNAILWSFARRAEWSTVGLIYNQLLRHIPSLPSLPSTPLRTPYFPSPSFLAPSSFPIPPTLTPSKVTYQLLLKALAFHGDLEAALAVLQDMLADPREYHPEVQDILALLHGFAAHGREAGGGEAGRRAWMDGVVPPFMEQEKVLVRREKREVVEVEKKRSTFRDIGKTFINSINDWDLHPSAPSPTPRPTKTEWTPTIFSTLFASLLACPATPPARAPTRRAVYHVLMAYMRTHGGDAMGLEAIWGDLENKFGGGNREGWVGWRLDARLRKLRAGWLRELNRR